MKTALILVLTLMMGACAAQTEDSESAGDVPTDKDTPAGNPAGTCLEGEDCGNDTPFEEGDAAGGTCLAGEDCGNDTPFEEGETADPFATCLADTDCGSDTPDDIQLPQP